MAGWKRPTYCNQCPHALSEHVLWEPDELDEGWMHCTIPGCTLCWHRWPKLDERSGIGSHAGE